MCGISGWLFTPGAEPATEVLERMSKAILHRGAEGTLPQLEELLGVPLSGAGASA